MASITDAWIWRHGISVSRFPYRWAYQVALWPWLDPLSTAILHPWALIAVSTIRQIDLPPEFDSCRAARPVIQAWRTLRRQIRVPLHCSTRPMCPIWPHFQWCTHSKFQATSRSMATNPKYLESPDHSSRQSKRNAFKLFRIKAREGNASFLHKFVPMADKVQHRNRSRNVRPWWPRIELLWQLGSNQSSSMETTQLLYFFYRNNGA